MTSANSPRGLMIAAPASGNGKTIATLGLLRAFCRSGLDVAGAKAGPDYIDPAYHQIACGKPSVNLDPWAMNSSRLSALSRSQNCKYLLVEAMMGLFDGAADGSGSAASLAKSLGIPIILVVDAARQSHSIAALVRGFRDHCESIEISGVILNRVGSARHADMLHSALGSIDVAVFGTIPRLEALSLPERHLGLVQAGEQPTLDAFLDHAADVIDEHVAVDEILRHFQPLKSSNKKASCLPALGNRIAIARDDAFSFIYPHLLQDWRDAGAQISFFSPLDDEAPDPSADSVFLPGGYPELHCGKISAAQNFAKGIRSAADRGAVIYGECGGYMVLGDGIEDEGGGRHSMLGLLRLETSFAKRSLHLGYRKLVTETDFVLGKRFAAHEFHYTTALREDGIPLFAASDSTGNDIGKNGLCSGNVMGSYMHVIDRAVL